MRLLAPISALMLLAVMSTGLLAFQRGGSSGDEYGGAREAFSSSDNENGKNEYSWSRLRYCPSRSPPEKPPRLPSPFRNPTSCRSTTLYKTAAPASSRTTPSKKICQTKNHGPLRSCMNETPPSLSRTAEHFCCVSSEPQNGLPSASPPEPPLPPSPTTSAFFSQALHYRFS